MRLNDGVEYWPIYAGATPGWVDSGYERDRVRDWFLKFAAEYGGAVPQGAWAATFRKIAWPITHAVLPRYLQVQLARLLYDYRTGWPSLLEDPAALGVRLHSWSWHYSDRLEKFCQNTALLGHVAVALLLSGEGEESPYIESTTLDRSLAGHNVQCASAQIAWCQMLAYPSVPDCDVSPGSSVHILHRLLRPQGSSLGLRGVG